VTERDCCSVAEEEEEAGSSVELRRVVNLGACMRNGWEEGRPSNTELRYQQEGYYTGYSVPFGPKSCRASWYRDCRKGRTR
jgi:hypothetical protein